MCGKPVLAIDNTEDPPLLPGEVAISNIGMLFHNFFSILEDQS